MNAANFASFFKHITGSSPYDYQSRLAGGDEGRVCESLLIDIPTGLGKTAAVVLAWLWNRVHLQREDWPRRLVICLPMRTLVEQTHGSAKAWLKAFDDREWDGKSRHERKIGLHLLMGGEDAGEWDIYPEAEAILIGTQDMLLSRALNRGYGMARARWPMHFGLLNNDALWIMDETQLMGVGVRTSAQLQGLREKIGVAASCVTWWASATLDARLLTGPDYQTLPDKLELGSDDRHDPGVARRIGSEKRLQRAPLALTADTTKALDPYLDKLAAFVAEQHQRRPDTLTLVILNRVNRARGLYERLAKLAKKTPLPELVLVHSRFRPMERVNLSERMRTGGERIVVSTQAIEAGVDLSACTLITELAPRSSLVQRFGRCNRAGEFNANGGADIYWINLAPEDEKAATGLALPYTPDQLLRAREFLGKAHDTGASPDALSKLASAEEPLAEMHVLRRKDLVELFDTTPDLAGLDIDVGRYIRDGDDRDVQVFWRRLPEKPTAEDLDDIVPQRMELVRVAQHDFRKFAEKKSGIWCWNALEGEWQPTRADRIGPGQVYLVAYALGGYSRLCGWTGENSKGDFPVLTVADQAQRTPRDGQDCDDETKAGYFESLEDHTAKVIAACEAKLATLPAAKPWASAMRTAALWHDLGKTHAAFQQFLRAGRDGIPPEWDTRYLAKSPRRLGSRHVRPHFRHELASALAWLTDSNVTDELTKNLVAYLIATHHGKIRLSIRAMPGEKSPDTPADGSDPLFARGVWHRERLLDPGTKRLALAGIPAGPITLDLSCMKMGETDGKPSWTSRMLALRDAPQLGLFRLAWLETILRAADAEGSKK